MNRGKFSETLENKHKKYGKNIVLDCTQNKVLSFFLKMKKIKIRIK